MRERIANYGIRNWDDVRVFLAVVRTGSFQKAGDWLGTNQSTVSRRIQGLEYRLGAKLFDRTNRGALLTPTGRVIQKGAESIEDAVLDIERGVAGVDVEMRGMVKITTTEGIGSYWLGPRMLDFQRRNPGLSIYIDTSNVVRDLGSREADIAVRFGRPDVPSYRIRHVANLKMRPFASKSYLREFGKPKSLEDFRSHYVVEYDPPLVGPLWDNWQRCVDISKGVVFRSNSSHAVARAADEGYGIGLMPIYVPDIHHSLEEIPIEVGPPLELWVVSHEETGRTRRVRATLDYIYKLFEVDRYRYFSG